MSGGATAVARRARALCRIGMLLLATLGSPCLPAAEPSYAGSEACADCHSEEYQAWRASHHYQAMLPASPKTVLGTFDGRTFEYAGVTSRFFQRNGKFMVETDDEKGNLREYEIAYTFGFYPLQQYLVAFPGGRYQALNIVWDSRLPEEGGQRWIHLYPVDGEANETPVTHEDSVHWTGSFQNWNSRCAVCHSTGLEKNYSAASGEYETRWREINVACEACHGPAAKHLEWAGRQSAADPQVATETTPNKGFEYSLSDRGPFGAPPQATRNTLARMDGKRPSRQVETCAACHARRSELGVWRHGEDFDDLYRLALIEPGLYFPDGQVRDEVYVYGSFLQSRMHAAGVVCTNCHEPHSNAVRVPGNGLCTQCHASAVYDQPAHHHHAPDSEGSACVECHMPARTYMVVDDRRDHSFRVPEPRMTIELGVPNACTGCHRDRDAEWAAAALTSWGAGDGTRATHAPILAAAWNEQRAALPGLLELMEDPEKPEIVRASAVLAAAWFPPQDTLASLVRVLYAEESLIRAAAVRALDRLPVDQRHALLKSLVGDPVKSVRMAVARQLADVPLERLPTEEANALAALRREYLDSLRFNADMPEEQLNLGLFHLASGDAAAAERAYREALKLSPMFVPALLNLADLYRANGMDQQARPLLERAMRLAPEDGAPQHAMGLLLIRQRQLEAALPYLRQAALLAPNNVRYGYVFSIALWESGRREDAVANLEAALASHPGDSDLISALASYYRQLGEDEKLRALQP